MKKRMSILGVLLLSVMLTGYFVSGTYAKYTSAIDLSDEARVAKWTIGLSDATEENLNLFDDSYDYDANGVVVKSLTNDAEGNYVNVVAPGTKGQYTFALTGTIETNYTIDIEANVSNTVVLKDAEGNVIYNPIRFYVSTEDDIDIDTIADTDLLTSADLITALEALYSGTDDKVYGPGSVPTDAYTIYWKWDFDGANTNHKYDTTLGEEIAADETSHTVNVRFVITATQTQAKKTA